MKPNTTNITTTNNNNGSTNIPNNNSGYNMNTETALMSNTNK